MPIHQKVVAIAISLAILIVIIELVRRRRLKEEYSWLWLITGVSLLVLTLKYELLVWLTALIGAVLPTSTLFFFGLIFLILIVLHFSVRISALSTQVKNLAQEVAILSATVDSSRGEAGPRGR